MRILLVTDTFAPSVNGVAVFTARLASDLGERGHDVHVLVPGWPGEAPLQRMGTHTLLRVGSLPTVVHPTTRACVFYGASQARRLLVRLQPEVVHVQSHLSLGAATATAARRLSIPVLGTFHIRPENLLLQVGLPRLLRRALVGLYWTHVRSVYRRYALVTVPAASAKTLLEQVGVSTPISVISNGVDVTRFSPQGDGREDEAVHRKYGLPRKKLVLYVGRLDRDKGIGLLADVIRRVAAGTDGHFVICGSGLEDARLRRVVKEHALENRVTFAGWVPAADLPSLYRLARAFIMTGRSETQPLAALEALASGLPVVGVEGPGLVDVVVSGETGTLVPPESPGTFAEEVRRLLDDDGLQERLAGQARRCAEVFHAREQTVVRYMECYCALRLQTG